MEVPALGSSQARARAQAEAAKKALLEQQNQAPELVLANYAFVLAYSGGTMFLEHDLDRIDDARVVRPPSLDEMYGALVWATYNAVDDDATEKIIHHGLDNFEWALLVVNTEDGRTLLYNKLDVPVSFERRASDADVLMSAEIVLSDLLTSKTAMKAAQATVQGMMQLGGAMQQQMSEQQANQEALAQAEAKFGGPVK